MKTTPNLQQAYAHCLSISQNHYENFPVASRLLPKRIRPAVTVIYTFARTADDFADEGNLEPAQRLEKLDAYVTCLDKIRDKSHCTDPVFIALADVITHHQLPLEPFYDLLSAFKQDVTKIRYANFGEVMDYCRRSANPVGRLLLHLFNQATPKNIACSDAICSALQLINFLQDISQDYEENNRIYMPQDELQRFNITEAHIHTCYSGDSMQRFMHMQVQRSLQLLQSGAPLGKILKGRIGFEIRMIIMGGSRILQKLHENRNQPFSRPRLNKRDAIWIFWRALTGK